MIRGFDTLMEMDRPGVRYWLPAACVDEEDLRAEVRALHRRGFGKIEVSCRTIFPQILASEEGWGKEHWNQVIRILGEETARLGMTLDITNGPGWPISMPTVPSADDEGAARELTYGISRVHTDPSKAPLPMRRTIRSEGTPVLIAHMAYREMEDGSGTLDLSSYRDLLNEPDFDGQDKDDTEHTDDSEPGETWRVFAFWIQPTAQKANAGQCYVIDHIGSGGTSACEQYWETQKALLESLPSMESFFCDSMEYDSRWDWTGDFAEQFKRKKGYDLLPLLPFVGPLWTNPESDTPCQKASDENLAVIVTRDYTEVLTALYGENHLRGLQKMAERYGKSVRYQVAYNKAMQVGTAAWYCAFPETEALGMATLDWLKQMAAAVHLGKKARYSFECAAEYANAYGQTHEDLFWWAKRAFMAGVNQEVLHGASYSGRYHGILSADGKVPFSAWPGFEAFRKCVSNYWNRTLSEEDQRGCLDALTRLNALFGRTAKVDLAVLRGDAYVTGPGKEHFLYDDGGALSRLGYSYEFVSPELLTLTCPVVDTREGRACLAPEGPAYRAILIPEEEGLSLSCLKQLQMFHEKGLALIFIGEPAVLVRRNRFIDYRAEERQMAEQVMKRSWHPKMSLLRITGGGCLSI